MTTSLSFAALTPYTPRTFVPVQIDFGNWDEIEPLFDKLEQRAAALRSPQELERWLLDVSELVASVSEEGSRRYIAMTCQTDDPVREKSYLQFVEQISPRLRPRMFRLAQLFTASPHAAKLPRERYFVLERSLRNEVELFRDENIPLETEIAKLRQQFQKLSGAMTVQFRGKEMTLGQMGKFLEEPDRAVRKEAWEKTAERRLQDKDKLDDLFDEMLKLRAKVATNAGFDNNRSYVFKANERFDYTPEDCLEFHRSIETHIVPLARELEARRAKAMNLTVVALYERRNRRSQTAVSEDALRPWDLAVDPTNRPPLRPFEKTDDLIGKTQKVFDKLNPDLAAGFALMRTRGLLDLDNRKGKAPGGYQSTLDETRLPFIFMNAVGVHRDVVTLLHESGHAFHALATQKEPLVQYRSSPIEFCEVASMSMELLAADRITEFYSEADARRSRREHLEGIIKLFPWIAIVDAFQHWIYLNPNHTRDQRRAEWLGLMDRFGGLEDWSGYEEARAYAWHRQLHIFVHPFYYVEYGIAQLGALQVWQLAKKDLHNAIKLYQRALGLGASRPLPELFTAAGLKFDFSEKTVGSLIQTVREELDKLGDA